MTSPGITFFFRYLIAGLAVLFFSPAAEAQSGPPNSEDEYKEMYKWRIRREILNGVYIPKDLGEAFAQLNQKIDKPSKEKYKSLPEEEAARRLHFSLGRWMIVNWSFYEGSRFAHFLRETGITHPDDMAWFVMITYHRYLNQQPLNVKELIEKVQEKRKKEEEEKKTRGTIIHEETRQKERDKESPAGGG